MSKKKKQTVAVAMATALGVSAMMSPVTVHAQEEDPATNITQESTQGAKSQDNTPVSEQGLPASEQPQELGTNGLQSGTPAIKPKSNGAFTNGAEEEQAIKTALAGYTMSNETTQEELQDFLNREFVDTGKLSSISVSLSNKTEATSDSAGSIVITVDFGLTNMVPPAYVYTFVIPRLPKAEEVAINETNFPDPIFRKYVKDKFDTLSDGVLSLDEISKITHIIIGNQNIGSLEGIEHFHELKFLWCQKNAITELNVSQNANLTMLDCGYTNISYLNISNNKNLTSLNCSGTKINNLNLSENIALTTLHCSNVTISELNLTNNPHLKLLNLSGTTLNDLDTSNNINLETLLCYGTKIKSLDVSKNTKLKIFDCTYTSLAWLNLGIQDSLGNFKNSDSEIDVLVTDSTFHIADMFEGINPEKIDENTVTGAVYNKDTGIMSDYTLGTSITYTYDCGTAEGIPQILNVTLNLSKSDSKIIIGSNLNMEYTGNPYEIPEIRTEGSKGELTFTYSEYINGSYEPIATAPTNVGKYAVYIELAEDEYNEGAVIEQTFFEITQAKNSWTNELAIKYWKENEKANKPTATAKFGDAVFTYSDSENGTYTSEVPTKAGTWYVKATVTGTENYTGLEDTKSFLIREAEPIIPNQPDEPTNPEEPGQPVKPDNPPGKVETGDTSQSGLLAVLSFLSAGCIAVLLRKRKKRNEA